MGGRFGSGMKAVLRNFVCAARSRLLQEAVEVMERAGAFADGKALFNCFGDVSLGEHDGVGKLASAGKLSGDGGGKSAAGAVSVFGFDAFAAESENFQTVEQEVDRLLQVATLDKDMDRPRPFRGLQRHGPGRWKAIHR